MYKLFSQDINLKIKHLNLKLEFDPNTATIAIYTDYARFRQIMNNLLNNAIKFTEVGEISFGYNQINVGNRKLLRFFVKDTGIGIQKDNLNAIFDRFNRLNDDRIKIYKGTGLGLAISKKLVNMLGGEIGVDSEDSVGSEFYFTIPYQEMDNSLTPKLYINPEKISIDWSMKRLLVVEDTPSNFILIENYLRSSKINILWAKSGKEAIILFKKNPNIDIVLMDIFLKGDIDGIDAAKSILALEIPVIYLTAHSDKVTLSRATENPASGYLVKPFEPQKLYNTIEVTLERQRKYLEEIDEIENPTHGSRNGKVGVYMDGERPRACTLIPELLDPESPQQENFKGEIIYAEDKITQTPVDAIRDNLKPVILVVEDEEITALDIKFRLEKLGYCVPETVSSGESAVQKACTIQPDLILMDIVLAGKMDGITAAETLMELDIPIVYLTAYADGETIKRARKTSPYGYLVKPFEDAELYTTVEMALSKHRSDVENVVKFQNKIREKSDELKIEKTGVFLSLQ